MILIIFNKIIKDKRGAVEYIESAFVIPIIILFISILFILSVKIINTSIVFETVYYNNLEFLDYVDNNFSIFKKVDKTKLVEINDNMNKKLKTLGHDKLNMEVIEGLFGNKIKNINENNQENYLTVSQIYPTDNIRKLDFIIYIFNSIKSTEIKGYSISELLNSIERMEKRIKEKIK